MEKEIYFEKHILIVDDSSIVRQLISTVLSQAGFKNIYQVNNGKAAIDLFTEKHIDLVLLDYNMPEMNGEEVLHHLKRLFPDVIVIMLSDQTDRNIVISLMRNADDYIVKAEVDKVKDEMLHVFNRCFAYHDLKTKNKDLMNKLSQRNKKLEEEIKMARKLQKEIFPDKIEKSDTFSIYVLSRQSEIIGGDFFSVIRLDPDFIGIFIGDICGHGIQAALLSFTLANAFKTAMNLKERISAQKTVKTLNSMLVRQFPGGSFAAGSYLVLNEKTASITFSGAFETPLLHYRTTGKVDRLINGNIVFMGLVDNDMVNIEESRIELQKGEKIIAFTDGLVEVQNQDNRRLGVEKIEKLLVKNRQLPVNVLCEGLYKEAAGFSNNIILDDVTIIGIERK
ncbi:MAG: fused response regulator/phosphatase [Spirochaetales bacterium]|nr:fused response regulator/phosphatase [Spirochaetales bacterium]